MQKGLFITVEGTDGSGKSTQLEFIENYFKEKNEAAIFTREPGGTPIGEKIRAVILDKKNTDMSPVAEMMLYAASRAQHVAQMIGPAVEHGRIVVCDRFLDSSLAYQGYARGLGDQVDIVNSFAVGEFMPDRTFLLKLDPEDAEKRMGEKPRDRMESLGIDFQKKVYQGYIELEKKYPDRIIGIDASRPADEVSEEIKLHLDRLMLSRKVQW